MDGWKKGSLRGTAILSRGARTSNGEIYDMHEFTAAHRTLPFNAMVRVTNLTNGKQTEVRINDRGPFVANRVIDLSLSAAQAIEMVGPGTAHVRLEVISGPNPSVGYFGVQVGAFLVQENAARLKVQLESRYPPVSVVPFESPNGTFYRVRIGRLRARRRRDRCRAAPRQRAVHYIRRATRQLGLHCSRLFA